MTTLPDVSQQRDFHDVDKSLVRLGALWHHKLRSKLSMKMAAVETISSAKENFFAQYLLKKYPGNRQVTDR